jgi:hypothetical protein
MIYALAFLLRWTLASGVLISAAFCTLVLTSPTAEAATTVGAPTSTDQVELTPTWGMITCAHSRDI